MRVVVVMVNAMLIPCACIISQANCTLAGVWDAKASAWALAPPANPDRTCVDMTNCTTDVLGFCYGGELERVFTFGSGGVYYIVSSEDDTDSLIELTQSATGTDMGHRDGDTLMTYEIPTGRGAAPTAAASAIVTGRVSAGKDLAWNVQDDSADIDTSFGPLNFVMTQ